MEGFSEVPKKPLRAFRPVERGAGGYGCSNRIDLSGACIWNDGWEGGAIFGLCKAESGKITGRPARLVEEVVNKF